MDSSLSQKVIENLLDQVDELKDGQASLGKLMYFPVMAKGLQLALIAELSGLPWEGATSEAEGPNSWPVIKASGVTPFGQMPFLVTSDGLTVGQSTAIANFMGKKGGMLGNNDRDCALCAMCMAEGEDLYSMLLSHELARWKPQELRDSKAEAVKTLFAESAPAHFANLEKLCGSAGFSSTGMTYGEIYLFGMLYQFTLVGGAGILAPYANLNAWFSGLVSNAAVKKVIAGESAIGNLGQYFMNDADYAAFNKK